MERDGYILELGEKKERQDICNLSHAPDQIIGLRQGKCLITSGESTYQCNCESLQTCDSAFQWDKLNIDIEDSDDQNTEYIGAGQFVQEGICLFHLEDRQGLENFPCGEVKPFYASIGIANVSQQKQPIWVRRIFESQLLKKNNVHDDDRYTPAEYCQQGVGDPSYLHNCDWHYLFFTDYSRRFCDQSGVQISVVRTKQIICEQLEPPSWEYYDFNEGVPCFKPLDCNSIQELFYQPIIDGGGQIHCIHPHVSKVDENTFIMVFGKHFVNESDTEAKRSGIYIAWSSDLVSWNIEETPRVVGHPIPMPGKSVFLHPQIIWTKINQNEIPESGILYYGHSNNFCVSDRPHTLWEQKIELRKQNE